MPYFLNIYKKIIKILTCQHKLILIPKESFMLHICHILYNDSFKALLAVAVTLLLTAIKIGHTKLYKSPKQTFALSQQHTV